MWQQHCNGGAAVRSAALLVCALLLLQQLELLLVAATVMPRSDAARAAAPNADKRAAGIDAGQPEEIFSLGNRLDSNYDEYPMVVPKRAALFLDRIMVALHHALEAERRKIGDFYEAKAGGRGGGASSLKQQFQQHQKEHANHHNYNSNNNNNDDNNSNNNNNNYSEQEHGGASLMYSDDDPSVMLDYDFKDLNSINRATGQTLVARSFQRRGHDAASVELGDDGIALLRSAASNPAAAATAAAAVAAAIGNEAANGAGGSGAGGGGGGGVGGRNNIGRMYWRCYFNAVSCF